MNGETLYQRTDYFRPFPEPAEVFASRVAAHAEYLLPLASVDLSHLKPEWEGPIHFVIPIEPCDGVVGEGAAEFHNYLCRDNWIGYRMIDGRYDLACDFGFFRKDALADHYQKVRSGYDLRAAHFRAHGCLHHAWAKQDASGQYDDTDRVALACTLGGVSLDGNWSNLGNFPISSDDVYIDSDGEEWRRASPQTEDGRSFEFIGSISMYHFIAENPDYTCLLGGNVLLFYDPREKVALTTFDWS